jgi:hypothetical protein
MTIGGRGDVLREVAIAPPSMRHELLTVVRVAMAIVFGVWLYLANSPFAASGSDASQRSLLPYQAFIRDRGPDEQRMFRELQVGLLEAETVRSMSGAWPTADALAADGVEPFALNPAVRGSRHSWRLLRDGRFVNYVGVPQQSTGAGQSDRAAGPAWLLLIQEPDPAAPEVFRADEEHHQLVDGSVLHVSLWSLPDARRVSATLTRAPQFEGWTQLYAAGPSAAHAGLTADGSSKRP